MDIFDLVASMVSSSSAVLNTVRMSAKTFWEAVSLQG